METFTPEFAAFWMSDAEAPEELRPADGGSAQHALSQSQQLALEELTERVNAARTVL